MQQRLSYAGERLHDRKKEGEYTRETLLEKQKERQTERDTGK